MQPLTKKAGLILISLPVLLISLLFFFSCKKELSNEDGGGISNSLPDLSTKISSSVSGFVTDENDLPVIGAPVQFGSASSNTDKYGYFEFRNIQVVQNAATVIVSRPGYFKGIKTYMAQAGKSAFFRIKLIPKTIVGNINGTSGGNVTLTSGLSIALPANAVVNASTNASYTGMVNVAAYYIDPTAADISMIMPGDLRGINTDGLLKLLQTYGMAAVELTGTAGELLQIASGKTTTLTMPIPASQLTNAPSSIPLWYFDESNGLWKEEGSAIKTGNNYVGNVAHFTYWNCDIPFPNGVLADCTVVNTSGLPVPYALIDIIYANGQYTGCHGNADSSGYACGFVPANSQLIMRVMDYSCPSGIMVSQPFTTTNTNIHLGNITVPASYVATISGSLLNCSNQPVTNGYLMVYTGNFYTRYNVNNSGNFSFARTICGNNNNLNIIGGDITTGQEGLMNSFPITNGVNNIGNIIACGTSNQEFMNYSVNGSSFSITPSNGTLYQLPDSVLSSTMQIYAYTNTQTSYLQLGISNIGIAPGSSQNLMAYVSDITGQTTIPIPVTVNITEYGSIGQFISGNFTGSVTGAVLPNTVYTVTCNFRVRRNY